MLAMGVVLIVFVCIHHATLKRRVCTLVVVVVLMPMETLVAVRSVCLVVSLVFFFFQAEDGIRDLTVTGVQTCALPIYRAARRGAGPPDARISPLARRRRPAAHRVGARAGGGRSPARRGAAPPAGDREIGRASCRERV